MGKCTFDYFFDLLDEIIENGHSDCYYSEKKYEDGELVKKVEREYRNGECCKDYSYEKVCDEKQLENDNEPLTYKIRVREDDNDDVYEIRRKVENDEETEPTDGENVDKDTEDSIDWKEKYLMLCERYGELEMKNEELNGRISCAEEKIDELESENECLSSEVAYYKDKLNKISRMID